MDGWIFILHWFMHQWRWDGASGRSPGIFSNLKTLVFLSMDEIPFSGWFMVYRKPFKLEVVFQSWERFHSPSKMWPREGEEYCPHRALILNVVGSCDMILSHRIKWDGSKVRNKRACWWVQVYCMVNSRASRCCDIILDRWIWRGESTLRISMQVRVRNIFYACFASWWESMYFGQSTCSRVSPPFGSEILFDWSLFPHRVWF